MLLAGGSFDDTPIRVPADLLRDTASKALPRQDEKDFLLRVVRTGKEMPSEDANVGAGHVSKASMFASRTAAI